MLFKPSVAVVVAAVSLVIALLLRGLMGSMPEKGGKNLEPVIKILVGIIIVWLLLLGGALRSPGGL